MLVVSGKWCYKMLGYFEYNPFVDITFILTLVALVLYHYSTKTFKHWEHRGIKYLKPVPFFGNTADFSLGKKNVSINQQDLYQQLKGERFGGIFMTRAPLLLLRDPLLIHQILTKDFQHFYDRGNTVDEKTDPLQANLVNLTGKRWKNLRQKLTPSFSSGKLKNMLKQLEECASDLITHLKNTYEEKKPVDARESMAKFSTDVIGSCAFGLQFNTLKDPESQFRRMGREIFQPSFRTTLRLLLRVIHDKLPIILGLRVFEKKYEDFFTNLVTDTIKYREDNKVERNDFIQIMMTLRKMDMNKNGTEIDNQDLESHPDTSSENTVILDDVLLVANTFIFFIAGFETTAATLSFCLFELAQNQEIQDKLRKHVQDILKKNDNEITYDTLKEMVYMDQVVSETIRKYPIAGSLVRKCTNPDGYNIPGTDKYVKENERVIIPVYALHHDPEYFPDPEKFDPERFNEENKRNIPLGAYLPFGDGPRICIGLRFAQVEMKVALTKILTKFSVSLNKATKLPLKFKPRRFLLVPEQELYLDLKLLE